MKGTQTVVVDAGKNITEMLEKIAAAMGTTVEQLYPFYCQAISQEALMRSIGCAMAFVVCLLLSLVFFWAIYKIKLEDASKQGTAVIILICAALFFSALSILSFTIFAVNFPTWYAQMMSPEAFVLHRIAADVGLVR